MSLDPRQPSVTGPSDPEHDPAASYALEPSAVKALTDRIVSTTGQTEPTYTPITGQPLAHVPQSSEADVEEAFVPGAPRAAGLGADQPRRPCGSGCCGSMTSSSTGRTRSST